MAEKDPQGTSETFYLPGPLLQPSRFAGLKVGPARTTWSNSPPPPVLLCPPKKKRTSKKRAAKTNRWCENDIYISHPGEASHAERNKAHASDTCGRTRRKRLATTALNNHYPPQIGRYSVYFLCQSNARRGASLPRPRPLIASVSICLLNSNPGEAVVCRNEKRQSTTTVLSRGIPLWELNPLSVRYQ